MFLCKLNHSIAKSQFNFICDGWQAVYMEGTESPAPQSKAKTWHKENKVVKHYDDWNELLVDKLPTGDRFTFF